MLAVALVTLIVVVALFRGNQIVTTMQFALVLTVAAIPVAMPTVLSVTMAVGSRLLAQKQAIVSRLAAIEEMAGILVKMVTGDQDVIAREIAHQLDLGPNILNADVFTESKQHEAGQVNNAIEQADGFAQVFPEHKYHIVDVLQKRAGRSFSV